ncbi:MAG: TonB-dependent receptor [Xanthomonadales bacterium]|nr:TonB-dependent receptor [Xanthomonadales bacterium]
MHPNCSPALIRRPLSLALTLLLAGSAAWAQSAQDERLRKLDEIEVQADPFQRNREELLQPVEVLAGAELDRRRANTLGETLDRQVGVQSSFFGPGAGRPVIRGQEGPRVQVLSDGVASQDVSTVSVDHAVTIDPFVAEQIEVIKGPAALLYGSGAVGGAVNVIDGRVPTQAVEGGFAGRAQIYGDTVADTFGAAARVDAGSSESPLVFHADAFYRDSNDYEIPGFASHEPDEDEQAGRVENSALETQGGALGVSLIGERGYLGLAISQFDTLYGVPGHAHEHGHEDEDEDGPAMAKGEEEEEEGPVRIDMEQTRYDLAGGLQTELPWLRKLRLRSGYTDYEHVELEGDEIGTRFENQQTDLRLEAEHAPIGAWRGVYGLTWSDRDFAAIGEEAFVPPNQSDSVAFFLVETAELGSWNLETGARWESQTVELDSGIDRDHDALSFSLAGRRQLNEHWSTLLRFDRAQRAPGAEELFSAGPHVATGSFEIGDAELEEETSQQFEVGVHYDSDALHLELSVFHNRFDDFIYLADTGTEEDELPVRQWSQADARFTGVEGLARYHLGDTSLGHFDLTARFDHVRARLADGGDLPRIAPTRFGLGLDWTRDAWSGSLDVLRVAEQDRVAEFEEETDGYTLLGADLAYSFDWGNSNLELFLAGRNLTDEEARVHTSLLKERAPLPGRNFMFGVRSFF